MNYRGEVPIRVAVLNTEYHVECSNGFAFGTRLPIEIESKVRELMMLSGTNERGCLERRSVVPPGLFMRVFLLLGTERYHIAVTLEPHDERAWDEVKHSPLPKSVVRISG